MTVYLIKLAITVYEGVVGIADKTSTGLVTKNSVHLPHYLLFRKAKLHKLKKIVNPGSVRYYTRGWHEEGQLIFMLYLHLPNLKKWYSQSENGGPSSCRNGFMCTTTSLMKSTMFFSLILSFSIIIKL